MAQTLPVPQTVPIAAHGTDEREPGEWATLGSTIPWSRGRKGAYLKTEFLREYAAKPLKREPLLRANRTWQPLKFFQVIGTKIENVEAFIITAKGEYPTVPCNPCRRGLGPWARCIIGDSDVSGTPLACNNCHHGGQGTRCNFDTRAHVSSHRVARSSEDASASDSPTPRSKLRQVESKVADARATATRIQNFIGTQKGLIDTISQERDQAGVLNGMAIDHLFADANKTAEELEKLAEVLMQQLEP